MKIVAKVFDWDITKTELDFEESRLSKLFPDANKAEIKDNALKQVIDRYLLVHEAKAICFNTNDDEFDAAFLEFLDDLESPDIDVLVNRRGRGEQIERVVKSNLLIKKYINSLDVMQDYASEKKLQKFYQERKDYFVRDDEVKASHILVKGQSNESLKKINEIRNSIHNPNDFAQQSKVISDCPSGVCCGDLGYFPRGRMIPEIDDVAFSLEVNEISQPFKSQYGYHILMVADKKEKHSIPFEEIKDSLKESLISIGREITLTRILNELRERCQNSIKIYSNALQ